MAIMKNLRRFTVQNETPARRGAARGLPNGRGLWRRHSGFSLVELCITTVLLGIVAAIAFPSFRGWVDNSNLKGAARAVSSDVYDTRGRALAENRVYTITYSADPTNTYTITAPAVATPVPLLAVNETKNFSEFGGVRMTSVNVGAITIQSRGTISPAARIDLANSRNSTGTVNVLNIGRAHVTYSMQ
jgi:prepilin-type N-terminal cleavage/methylation domain-containing protein